MPPAAREFWRRLIGTIRRHRADPDLEEELRIHFDMLVEEAERQGHSRAEALHLARLRAGGAPQAMEQLRDQRGWPWLDDVIRDGQLAWRLMRRGPLFTIVAVASLALGIGANTAIFSLVNAILLRPLPVREPAGLVEILSQYPGEPRINGFQWRIYEHFRDQNRVFSDLVAMSPARWQVSGEGLDAVPVTGEYVSGNYFDMLGVPPALGRVLGRDDDRAGAAAVAVVSWAFWQSRFAGDPSAVGQRIVVNGAPAVVVGVTPREFFGANIAARPAMWLATAAEPLIQRPSQLATGMLGVAMLGRLAPGIAIEQARAEVQVLDRWRIDLLSKTAPLLRDLTIHVESAATGRAMLRDQFASPLMILAAIVGLMLLVACANVGGLLLARGAARQREMALRLSLGAARSRLLRQLLTESLLLAAIGGVLGVGLAYAGVQTLTSIVTSGRSIVGLVAPITLEVALDARVLAFTAGVSLLSGLLFGLAPAWQACRSQPAASLREAGSVGESRSRRLFGRSLVVVQVAVSLVLLSTASLFIGHLAALRNVDLGFDRHAVLLLTIDTARTGHEPPQLFQPYQTLLAQLEALPGVRSATVSGVTPIHGAGAARFVRVPGFEEPPEARQYISLNWVAPRYFETFGTPMIAGRDFRFDDRGRAPVAIVNQAMARHYFGGGSAIGRTLTLDGITRTFEVVGVVGDAKYLDLRRPAPQTVYLNAFQEARMFANRVSLRTDGAPMAAMPAVQQIVAGALARDAISNVTTLSDQVDASMVPERLLAALSAGFGVLGAVLVGIGLYGLLAFSVARRTNEIGVRMALGATPSQITRMVLTSAAALVAAGLAAGVPVAWWGRSLAVSVLAELHVESMPSLVLAAAGIVAVALLASSAPAWRAARVDPAQALRRD